MDRVGDRGEAARAGAGGGGVLVVGFAFMAKKMESMAEVMSISEGPVDGVEFVPLDFWRRPTEHRHLDVILHKLSEDIMFRGERPEGDARISWIEAYLAGNPGTVIVDPIDRVANCINRVTTLELLQEAYRCHGVEGGMPRPPRFTVLDKVDESDESSSNDHTGAGGIVSVLGTGLTFPVICKPVEACGTRGSHAMLVVLDEAGMVALKPPVVVQECRSHGAKLFKVCVVGDEVRVHERPSLPDLPQDLTGSFAFDSQKPYPTLAQVEAASAQLTVTSHTQDPPPPRQQHCSSGSGTPGAVGPSSSPQKQAELGPAATRTAATESAPPPETGRLQVVPPALPHPGVTLEAATQAATRMRETFGLSMFGFDLIVDGTTGETLVIDVNYFPSFKDLRDFPQLLRRWLKEAASSARTWHDRRAIK